MLEKSALWIYRLLFLISSLILILALLQRLVLFFGYQLLPVSFGPMKLLQIAAVFGLFTVLLLLRQVRDELKKTTGKS